jgi:hypothetical protein
MGIRGELGRLVGKGSQAQHTGESPHRQVSEAEQARDLARYKYLLRVASSESLEQAHQAAFADLRPEQRERLCHDLPEEDRPISSSPAELAHAAVVAQEADHGYLVRMLRRPGHGLTESHSVDPSAGHSLFADSVLGQVAAAAAGSGAVSTSLAGFENSLEAAQIDASVFVRPPGPLGHAAWEAGFGGAP